MSLKKNLIKNGIASLFQKGVKVLEQLFLVPFFITAWGPAYYGEWLTLSIVPSIIGFSDLGFGTAAANSFVLQYASGDYQKAANTNRSGLYIITLMIICATIISVLVMVILSYFGAFNKSLIERNEAITAVSVLVLARLLDFYTQLIESYYRAARRAALSINLLSIKSGLNLGAGLLILLAGYGVIAFALSQLIVVVLFNLYYWTKGTKILGSFKDFKGVRDRTEIKSITSKGLGYLMSPVWQAIYFQGSTFVVRIVLGAEAVAAFNTVRTLARSVNQVYNMGNSVVFPELQFELGIGNWEKGKKLYRTSVLSMFILGLLGVVFLVFFGLQFYKIWTHNALKIPSTMWYIIVAGILFNAIWWTSGMVFRALNKPYVFSILGVICACISVGVSYALSFPFGLIGAAIGSVTLDVLMAALVLPYACKMMQMDVIDLFKYGITDLRDLYSNFNKKK